MIDPRYRVGLLWAMLVMASPVWSQSAPAANGPSPDAIADLQRQIDERYASLEKDTTFDEATRAGGLSRLEEGRAFLARALADIEATEVIAHERAAAPELQASAEAALAAPAVPGASEEAARTGPSELKIAADSAASAAQAAQRTRTELEERRSALRARRPLIGPELAAARAALTTVRDKQLEIRVASETRPGTRTSLLRALAEEQALLARIAFLEEQRAGLDVRERLLAARIELARRKTKDAQEEADRLRDAYEQRRKAELIGATGSGAVGQESRDPQVRALAEANAALLAAYPRERMAARLAMARSERASLEAEFADVEAESQFTERTLESLGRSYAAGQIVVEALRELPQISGHENALRQRTKLIEQLQVEIIGLSRERLRLERELGSEAATKSATPSSTPSAASLRSLGEARLELLETTIQELEEYVGVLAETQVNERTLSTRLDNYESALRSRQAWLPNVKPVTLRDARGALRGMGTLVDAHLWRGLVPAFTAWLREAPLLVSFTVLAMLAAFAMARSVGRAIPALVQRPAVDSVLLRFAQRALPALSAAAALAFGVWLAGWLFHSAPEAPPGAVALGMGLQRISGGVFVLVAVHYLYGRQGPLLQLYGHWSEFAARVRRVEARLVWALALLVISLVLFDAHVSGIGVDADLAARLCVILAIVVIVWALHAALTTRGTLSVRADTTGRRSSSVGSGIVAMTLLVLLLAAVTDGYVLATLMISRAVLFTLALTAIYRAVKVLVVETHPATGADGADALVRDRNYLVGLVLILALALALLWVWGGVFQALRYLREITLWTTEGAQGIESVTVASLLIFLVALAATLIAFWALPIVAGTRSLDPSRPDIGTRYATITLIRYAVLIAGTIWAFSLLNVGWSKLQWMAAGLSVGLGFGLQESVANFIAGLMLLTEGQVRVGDLITVGDKTGLVSRIQMRATTVKDFDGREVILPNKGLVTTEVTNWTLSDSNRRLQVVVGVAYGSDTDLVEKLMLQVAQSVSWLLTDPPPRVVFEQFGDSALNFRMYVWVGSGQLVLDTVHALHRGLERVFREHGIEIAFPQRDIHVDATEPLSVRVVAEPPAVAPQS